jgi:hypothetical protein
MDLSLETWTHTSQRSQNCRTIIHEWWDCSAMRIYLFNLQKCNMNHSINITKSFTSDWVYSSRTLFLLQEEFFSFPSIASLIPLYTSLQVLLDTNQI